MRSLWDDSEARVCGDDPLSLRVYTSRLIGREPSLVLHGGGNTSVKATAEDVFGDPQDAIWVKGSGWDLATIERGGFAPLRLDGVQRMAGLDELTDTRMVTMLRSLLLDPAAPTPSVEAILHAIIPFRFVDHTHADAVVTITNTPGGMERIGEVYGDRIFIVPYVMPGFDLAREVYSMTRDMDWEEVEGIILLNHGVFTFGDDARSSYERMIQIVTEAEDYLDVHAPWEAAEEPPRELASADLRALAAMRREVSRAAGKALVAAADTRPAAVAFSERPDVAAIATRGPLTPDHVIRTKRVPVVFADGEAPDTVVEHFVEEYRAYFERNAHESLRCLDPAPRWVVWPGRGTLAFGGSPQEAAIASDIVAHTFPAIERAELLEAWESLPEDDIFDVEYWELEQAKLARLPAPKEFAGRVALVTGAASGIGRATVDGFVARGACVVALDINDDVTTVFTGDRVHPVVCNVTDAAAVQSAIEAGVRRFGGLDVVVSNAGIFPATARLAELQPETWRKSREVNLDAHLFVIQKALPFLESGIDPAVVIVGSKNVAAPGKGAAAYSVAKAGLTQLARVAALEFAPAGIRVNVLHPNDVFDTGIWSPEVLEARAREYGMDVDAYRRRNLLGVEIASSEVAALAIAMAGPLFARTTGAQVPVDGGNDRVV
ncbi:MAG TPA: bifunctional aldolase/short-chain dehydrogenase [Candidatus Krumholzibacteria bacterium]|nr:bifunctional aldolase/short-chain dehydrogenase [Candidatus Krumholzibacteria bacterium]